jgi:hypothetical protein
VTVPERVGRTILELRAEELRLKRLARNAGVGLNRANAIADLDVVFPWSQELRQVSPTNTLHSYLMPYWYRAGQRWVLYDVLPVQVIDDDLNTGSGVSGADLKAIMAGPRPSERTDEVPVSDLQHEMFRRWNGYARPFWVLQGENGGHQVKFSPAQSDALLRKGLQAEPPAIGSLAPCPFDNRAIRQLQHLNRLHQMEDSIDRLRKSGSPEAAAAEQAKVEREIRESEMAFIEAQVRPITETAMSLVAGSNTRSEHDNEIIRVPDGTAARVNDAYQRWLETGDYTIL